MKTGPWPCTFQSPTLQHYKSIAIVHFCSWAVRICKNEEVPFHLESQIIKISNFSTFSLPLHHLTSVKESLTSTEKYAVPPISALLFTRYDEKKKLSRFSKNVSLSIRQYDLFKNSRWSENFFQYAKYKVSKKYFICSMSQSLKFIFSDYSSSQSEHANRL